MEICISRYVYLAIWSNQLNSKYILAQIKFVVICFKNSRGKVVIFVKVQDRLVFPSPNNITIVQICRTKTASNYKCGNIIFKAVRTGHGFQNEKTTSKSISINHVCYSFQMLLPTNMTGALFAEVERKGYRTQKCS